VLRRLLGGLIASTFSLGVLLALDGWREPVPVDDDSAPPASVGGTTLPPLPSTTTTTFPFATPGLLTFRGSPTRSFYGTGPMPVAPTVLWSYPDRPMCSESTVGGETTVWCGTGWTGQPSVFERDGRTWVAFGAYDAAVHFVDGLTGEDILPPFQTDDIIKGSVTIDPDGYPLLYTGSRDNRYRVIAFDRDVPTELWALHADDVSPTRWNDDWDGSGLVIDDVLYEGGENSQWHMVRLGRGYGEDGLVVVDPSVEFHAPGWDDELLGAIGDGNVSIEGSVAVHDGVVYFANSGGLVQGWDVTGAEPQRVFRYWTGDDTDATVVIDDEGMLYVASEYERGTTRSREVGQLLKLDPSRPDDPLVWSIHDRSTVPAGMWATPALHRDMVYVATNGGELLGVSRSDGTVRWRKPLPGPTWQSPVVVDDVLVQGDCEGVLHAYDVRDTTAEPPELWSVELGGCIESTPAVWNGRIYVGTRGGFLHAVGDA
jgi:outer membrane protein assembly factor BamB